MPRYEISASLNEIRSFQNMTTIPSNILFQERKENIKLEIRTMQLYNRQGEFEGTVFYNEELIKKVGGLEEINVDGTFDTRPIISHASQLLTVMAVLQNRVNENNILYKI